MSYRGKYGLMVADSVVFGYKGQFEEAERCHNLVADYLDNHLDKHQELLYANGHAKYYEVLKLAMSPEQWKEFMKPKPWDIEARKP